eukprot:2131776-Rhodomonas_salina.1
MNTFPCPSLVLSCAVCGRAKELDVRGYPRGDGSTVRARCGHHFCSECLLQRISHAAPHKYHCEEPGCGQPVAHFTICCNVGDGTEPFATECTWGGAIVESQAVSESRESGRNLRDAHGTVLAQAVSECRLLSLTPAVLGLVWPAERVVVGLRVCKELRRDLMVHCNGIVLAHGKGASLCERCLSEDFKRLPEHLTVTFKGNETIMFPLGMLAKCKTLVHLDLRSNGGDGIGDEGAGRLAG